MNTAFIPVTQLQRNTKKVLNSDEPFQIILNNNDLNGLIVNKETTKFLIESGVLEQLREEMFELNDPLTIRTIKEHRTGKSKPVEFDTFLKKHEL